ncbi:glycosyl hydrolase family 28-related protein [Subtercola sp. RTI3]|nr:glycosyl hydrolase family 28-related protein [Subtercola sp. RTI3]
MLTSMDTESEKKSHSRRNLFLGLAGAVAATAVIAEPAQADVTYIPTTEKGAANGVATLDANSRLTPTQLPMNVLSVFNVRDYGALGDGVANDGTAIAAAVSAAGASTAGGVVGFPPGTYLAEGLTVPAYVILRSLGGGFTRFGPDLYGGRKASVRIFRPTNTSTAAMVTLAGAGSGIEGIVLEGNGAPGTILEAQGFESTLNAVRCISGTGIGLDIQKANNTRWHDVFVDSCGSSTLPAVKIWSKTGAGGANETNTLDIDGLTIERSKNVALEIAVGTDAAQAWAEWVRIFRLHVESSGMDSPNVDPLINIGNVRSVTFVDPFIYGGPGPLIRHNQQVTRTYGNGGIRLIGGTLNGSDTTITPNPPLPTPTLVDLVAGNDFAALGTRFMRQTAQAVSVASAYGPGVWVDASSSIAPGGTVITDGRSAKTIYSIRGNSAVDGELATGGDVNFAAHLRSTQAFTGIVVTNTTGGGLGAGAPAATSNANDTAGRIFFGSGTGTAAGQLVSVTFATPYTNEPVVVLTAGTAAAQQLGLYVSATTTGFVIRSTAAPAASQSVGTFQVKFVVIGLSH